MSDSDRFLLGEVEVSQLVRSVLRYSHEEVEPYLSRHRRGDWGDVCPESAFDNEVAAQHGERIISSYSTEMGHHFFVVTEPGHDFTRVVGADEF